MQLIIDVDEKLVFEGFERPFTEEERATLIRAIGNGRTYNPSDDCIKCGEILASIKNVPPVEITEEQAINKLHETGWLIEHDKEMTTRPKGEWERGSLCGNTWLDAYYKSKCSECEHEYKYKSNFCPNCGADMRKGGA